MEIIFGELVKDPEIRLDENNYMKTFIDFKYHSFVLGGLIGDYVYENYSKGDLLRVFINNKNIVYKVNQL